jgi:hypothetical protein
MLTCESIGEWRSGGGDQRWTVVFDEWGKLVMLDELGLLGFSAWCGVEGGRRRSFIAVQGRFKLGDKEYDDDVLWFMLTVAGWTCFNCDVGRAGEGPGRRARLWTHRVELQWHLSTWIQLLQKAVARSGEVGKVLEATVAGSGNVRRGSELGGDDSEQQHAARLQLCFVTQGRRKVRRKRESRGWLGQMSWTMRKNWTGAVEGRWAARARLFLVFYFIY